MLTRYCASTIAFLSVCESRIENGLERFWASSVQCRQPNIQESDQRHGTVIGDFEGMHGINRACRTSKNAVQKRIYAGLKPMLDPFRRCRFDPR